MRNAETRPLLKANEELKLSLAKMLSFAVNEYVCMKPAKYSGLSVPDVSLKKIQDETFIMVNRLFNIFKFCAYE